MTTTTTTNPARLMAALQDVRQILDTLDTLTADTTDSRPSFYPDPDPITETMRIRFSGRATAVRDYQTGEPLPIDPDTVTPDMARACPVIELPRGIAYTIRTPYLALVRDSHAEIVTYCEVFRAGHRYSGQLSIALTPEAMPGIGQPVRPYWHNYPRAYVPHSIELPPGARDAVARSVADLVPELPPAAILAARIHALHKDAAGELYAGLSKARREIANAIQAAARHAQTAGQITGQ